MFSMLRTGITFFQNIFRYRKNKQKEAQKIKFCTETNIVKDKLLPRKQTRTLRWKRVHHSANGGTDSAVKDLLGLIKQTEDL